MLEQMTLILLPIVLFIINLVVTLILRESDNRKRGITGVKKLTGQYKSEIEKQLEDFRSEVAELEDKVTEKDRQLHSLIDDINREITKLESYQDDMANLRQCMDTYREALAGLAKLTNDADSKINLIEADVQRLEEVRNMVDSFRLDMKDADEHLRLHENTVIQMQKDTMAHLETSVTDFRNEVDGVLDNSKSTILKYYDALEEKLTATRKATEDLHREGVAMLNGLGDRLNDQHILAEEIAQLTRTRNELKAAVGSLEKDVEEKKSFASELDEITRNESQKLANLRQEVEKLETKQSAVEPVIEMATVSEPVLASEPVEETVFVSEPESEQEIDNEVFVDELPKEDPRDEIIIEDDKEEEIIF